MFPVQEQSVYVRFIIGKREPKGEGGLLKIGAVFSSFLLRGIRACLFRVHLGHVYPCIYLLLLLLLHIPNIIRY